MSKSYKGMLHIGRPRGSGLEYVSIEVQDETSLTQFVGVHVDPRDFAEAMFGLYQVPCEFWLRGVDLVGMQYEHKSEPVFVPDGAERDIKKAAKVLKPLEVDGWIGDVGDTSNMHRWVHGKETPKGKKGRWYNVTFRRHVPLETGPQSREDVSR